MAEKSNDIYEVKGALLLNYLGKNKKIILSEQSIQLVEATLYVNPNEVEKLGIIFNFPEAYCPYVLLESRLLLGFDSDTVYTETNYKRNFNWVKETDNKCRIKNRHIVHVGGQSIISGQFEMWSINSKFNQSYSMYSFIGIYPSLNFPLVDDGFRLSCQVEL